jgi:hypothetical protein
MAMNVCIQIQIESQKHPLPAHPFQWILLRVVPQAIP